jgi:flagellar protein FliO/FliZ
VKSRHNLYWKGRGKSLPPSGKWSCILRGLLLSVLLLIPVLTTPAQESGAVSNQGESTVEQSPVSPPEESLPILGGEEEASEPVDEAGPLVSSWDFLRMILILAAVVAVIYFVFYLLKRGLRRQLPQNELIHLLGTRSLSGNRALHLVELGKQVFLVGSAEGGISLISEIRSRETLDTIALERAESQSGTAQGFAKVFQSLLKTGKREGAGAGETIDFMKQQRQRLEKL